MQRSQKNIPGLKRIITRSRCNLKSGNNTVKVLAEPKNDERRREGFGLGEGKRKSAYKTTFYQRKG